MSIETINLTPTRAGQMTILITLLENGNPEGKKYARAELMKIAAFLQQYDDAQQAAESTQQELTTGVQTP